MNNKSWDVCLRDGAWMRTVASCGAVVTALLSFMSGCSSTPAHPEQNVSLASKSFADVGADNKAQSIEIPPDVARALMPALPSSVSGTERLTVERRFDVAANNAPAREVFVGLAEGTPYSVVVHPDVQGNISLDLKGVTFIEALEVLRTVHGYDYERAGNRVMVMGQGMRTRMFSVNYLNLARKGVSEIQVASTDLNAGGSSSGSKGGGSGGSSRQNISVTTQSDANFWKELRETLEAIIGIENGRKVIINPQSNLVVVRAMPAELDLVESFLGATHENVNRQVVLEAKILEVRLNEGFQAGVNWAALGNSGGTDYFTGQIGGGSLLNGSGVSDIAGAEFGLQRGDYFAPTNGMVTSAFGGMFSMALHNADNFAAFVELLKMQGDVQVLSSPRVSTINNQKAVIKVGGDQFYITGVTSGETQGTGEDATKSGPEIELTAFFSGIALDVTPQIDGEGNIVLHIHPTVSEVAHTTRAFTLDDSAYEFPTAVSDVQESDNVVRARSGQIIVIGGLMKESISEQTASVPVLGELPLVGALFQHTRRVRVKKELVILLKPTVVTGGEQWKREIGNTRDRMVNFSRVPQP